MTLRDRVADVDPEALLADGFDEACIGICYRASQPPVVAYSREKCIEILMDQGLSWEDAEEHFEFNVVGAWVGDRTPVFIAQLEEEEEEELPPKPPRAPGVTLDSLRGRMNRPFYDNYSRGLAIIDRQSGGVLSKYADTPVAEAIKLGNDIADATEQAFDRPLFPGLIYPGDKDASADGTMFFVEKDGPLATPLFEPPAPVFVPPGTALRDDLGNLPEPGDLVEFPSDAPGCSATMPSNQTHVTIRSGLAGAVQAMVGGLTEREQQVLKERFGVPKRSRHHIGSDIENIRLKLRHRGTPREERKDLLVKLNELFRERDDLDKP